MSAKTGSRPNAATDHLAFVDGLRGMAAMYVVLGHAYGYTREWLDPALPGIARKLLKLIDQGHSAVAVFIVVSGFCLMMPLCKKNLAGPLGGNGRFLRRRATR